MKFGIHNFSFTKMHLKKSSAKWWPFCPGGHELTEVNESACQNSLLALPYSRWSHGATCSLLTISSAIWLSNGAGPCITNVFATCRKNISQWHRSFQRKLGSHWLKFLRHVAITLVIQVIICIIPMVTTHIYIL